MGKHQSRRLLRRDGSMVLPLALGTALALAMYPAADHRQSQPTSRAAPAAPSHLPVTATAGTSAAGRPD